MASIDRRKTTNGDQRYRVRIRRGSIVETATFEDLAEARAWAAEVESAIGSGRWSDEDRGSGVSFGWILDRYLADRRPGRDARRQLECWRRYLADDAVVEVSRRRVLRLRRRLLQEAGPTGRRRSAATVNRYIAALSALFSWAVKRQFLDHHPLQGVEKLPEGVPRTRFLDDRERQALIEACARTGGARLEALVVLALSTGARRGELMALRWSDLDLVERRIHFGRHGRSRERSLPLPEPAAILLQQLARVRRIDSDFVFVRTEGGVRFPRASWRTALVEAGISDFRFRDLRHSAAAYLARSGASLPEIAAVLGTRTLESVRRYADFAVDQTPRAIHRMHAELFET